MSFIEILLLCHLVWWETKLEALQTRLIFQIILFLCNNSKNYKQIRSFMQRYERVPPLNTSIIRKKNVFWTQISVWSVITRKIDFQELTLRARTVFKNFIKKCRQFRCTGLLHSSKTSTLTRQKFGFFYAEFSVEFNGLILFF